MWIVKVGGELLVELPEDQVPEVGHLVMVRGAARQVVKVYAGPGAPPLEEWLRQQGSGPDAWGW